jgi:hypothetical protein
VNTVQCLNQSWQTTGCEPFLNNQNFVSKNIFGETEKKKERKKERGKERKKILVHWDMCV